MNKQKSNTNNNNSADFQEKMKIVMQYDLERIKRSLKMYDNHLEYMRKYQKKVTENPEKAERRRELNREASRLRMRRIRAERKEMELLSTMTDEQRKKYYIKKELKELQEKELQEKMNLLEDFDKEEPLEDDE